MIPGQGGMPQPQGIVSAQPPMQPAPQSQDGQAAPAAPAMAPFVPGVSVDAAERLRYRPAAAERCNDPRHPKFTNGWRCRPPRGNSDAKSLFPAVTDCDGPASGVRNAVSRRQARCARPRGEVDGLHRMVESMEAQARAAQAKATDDAAKTKEQRDRAQLDAAERLKVFGGNNVTVKPSDRFERSRPATTTATLSFEATDIRDVAKTILFDILGENYYIDPQVGGNVTFRTVKPIPRNSLIPILEMLLRGVNSALVKEAGIFKVVPATQAVRGTITPQLIGGPTQVPPGYSVVVMPLKFIGIKEMLRILEPFAKEVGSIRGDELRNLVILTGTERELRHLLETIEMFDIDWMAGMSVGFFQLHSVDVKNVVKELEAVFGTKDLGSDRRALSRHADRASQCAARDLAAEGRDRSRARLDRAPRQRRQRRRSAVVRVSPAERARRQARADPAAGDHRTLAADDSPAGRAGPDAGHRRNRGQPDVADAASRQRRRRLRPYRAASRPAPRRRLGGQPRRVAQRADHRRQGQQRDRHPGDADRVRGHREARSASSTCRPGRC